MRDRVSIYFGATLTRSTHPPTQVIRAVPYDAVRLSAYEAYKSAFKDSEGNLPVPARLCAGALAGMTSTLVTYPLDTIRFRLAIDPAMKTIPQVRRIAHKVFAGLCGLLSSAAHAYQDGSCRRWGRA